MDLSRFPRRHYTEGATPIEPLGITVVSGGSDVAAAMQREAEALVALGRRGYVIPGGGSNAIRPTRRRW